MASNNNKNNKNNKENSVIDKYFDFNKLYDNEDKELELTSKLFLDDIKKPVKKQKSFIEQQEQSASKKKSTNLENDQIQNNNDLNSNQNNLSTNNQYVDIYESQNEIKDSLDQSETTILSLSEVHSLIESALYIVGNDGLSVNDLKKLTGYSAIELRKILKNMNDELEKNDSRGICIKNFGDRYKYFSKSCNREKLSNLITVKYRNPLSQKVMETLAIIAYNQPCTKSIIEKIRLKDPTSSIDKLIELELVCEAGRADTIGRPILYTVTHKFYDIFGIKNISDLPKINLDQIFQEEDFSFFDTTKN